jgi:hypothetical protein
MATPRKKQRYTPQQRQEYVEQFERSGLTQTQFCRQVKLHPVTFSLWRRKWKAKTAVFAEVQIGTPITPPATDASVPGSAAVLHLCHGTRLELVLGGESAWAGLGLILKTLQA